MSVVGRWGCVCCEKWLRVYVSVFASLSDSLCVEMARILIDNTLGFHN